MVIQYFLVWFWFMIVHPFCLFTYSFSIWFIFIRLIAFLYNKTVSLKLKYKSNFLYDLNAHKCISNLLNNNNIKFNHKTNNMNIRICIYQFLLLMLKLISYFDVSKCVKRSEKLADLQIIQTIWQTPTFYTSKE